MTARLRCCFLCAAIFAGAPAAAADADYFAARALFWQRLYAGGGETLYCGARFTGPARRFNMEHVFAMAWAARALDCGGRKACREKSALFRRVAGDLHNLYPALAEVNQARAAMAFGTLPGERRILFRRCDFEVDAEARIVEPRPVARGKIARAVFYTAARYGFPIFPRHLRILQQWNRRHPPDAEERRRNNLIAQLQGARNPFIDDPSLADSLPRHLQ